MAEVRGAAGTALDRLQGEIHPARARLEVCHRGRRLRAPLSCAFLDDGRHTTERDRFEQERTDPDLLFRRSYDDLFRYCRIRCDSPEDTEDIVAQVFADALPSLPRLRWQGRPVVAFLYTIAGRRLADRARRAGRTEPLTSGVVAGLSPAVDDPISDATLVTALRELGEEQRLALFLRLVADRTLAEVASVLGRSEKATEHLIYRGLGRVRDTLAAEGAEP